MVTFLKCVKLSEGSFSKFLYEFTTRVKFCINIRLLICGASGSITKRIGFMFNFRQDICFLSLIFALSFLLYMCVFIIVNSRNKRA